MQLIKGGFAKLFKPARASTAPTSTLAGVIFSSSPCYSCEKECSIHEQLPATMQKRIDQGPLLGTFKPYLYHILIRSGNQSKWPEKVEEESESLAEIYTTKLKDSKKRIMVTLFDEDSSDKNMYVFPSGYQITEQNITGEASDKVTNWILERQQQEQIDLKLFESSIAEPIPESIKAFVLVCAHMKRDKKCGIAGPLLIKEFKKSLDEKNLGGSVPVLGVSHIGGHKFAGNVIIYSRTSENSWVADWYGRVKTCHVAALVKECVEDGKVIEELWRGRMGDPTDPTIKW